MDCTRTIHTSCRVHCRPKSHRIETPRVVRKTLGLSRRFLAAAWSVAVGSSQRHEAAEGVSTRLCRLFDHGCDSINTTVRPSLRAACTGCTHSRRSGTSEHRCNAVSPLGLRLGLLRAQRSADSIRLSSDRSHTNEWPIFIRMGRSDLQSTLWRVCAREPRWHRD